jgi:hypothetical protein
MTLHSECERTRSCLGAYIDREADAATCAQVEAHLAPCAACSGELRRLRELGAALAAVPRQDPPRNELWEAIARRLDRPVAVRQRRLLAPVTVRRLTSAAAVALAVGLALFAFSGPGSAVALAAQVDFRPLLSRTDGDIGAGIRALMLAHGGRPISAERARQCMKVRVHPPARLPAELRLDGLYLLNMGRSHRSLGFHFVGPRGQLLLLQCPPGIQKRYGDRECMACTAGGREGQVVRSDSLRLMHFESENVCICVVSSLDDGTDLPAVLESIRINY